MSQSPQGFTKDNKNEVIFGAFLDLEVLVQEYRKAVLWLVYGNHEATPQPTVQATRELMKLYQEKIAYLLDEIEAKTQQPQEA
jgi:hypothetical protein